MIVLFIHQKGGVGKSTLAINLTYQMKNKYKEIKLLDLDSQNSALLFNKLRKQEQLPTVQCYKEDVVELKFLLHTYSANKKNLLVVDSGGFDSDLNREVLLKADCIITPVGISQIEIFGLQQFRKILKNASKVTGKTIKTNVLLNNIDSRSKKKLKKLQEYINDKNEYFSLLNTIIFSRADYKNSYGEGLTVKEYNKKGAAQEEIKKLSKEIYLLINN